MLPAVLLAGCGGDHDRDRPRAQDRLGEVVTSVDDPPTTHTTTVQLPTGRLTLSIGDPVHEVGSDRAADAEDHVAGATQVYVAVTWAYVVGQGLPGWATTLTSGDDVEVPLAVVSADGAAYDVGVAARGPGTAPDARATGGWVLVNGDGRGLSVRVGFDGVSRTVDVASDAASAIGSAARPTAPAVQDCTAIVAPASVGGDLRCGWWHATLPWVADLGWADPDDPESAAWVVAQVGTQGTRWTDGPRSYLVTAVEDDVADTQRSLDLVVRPTSLARLYVLAPGTSAVPVDRSVTGELTDGDGPTSGSLHLRAELPVTD